MGCGEGDTEGKARRFGWKEAVGGLAVLAGVAGGVVWAHHIGYTEAKREDAAAAPDTVTIGEHNQAITMVSFDRGPLREYTLFGDFCRELHESLVYEKADGTYTFVDADANNWWEFPGAVTKHDGHVDVIRTPADATLLRKKDYDANKVLFDEADKVMAETRERFRGGQ